MGLLDWLRGRDSIERSVLNKALDYADREKAETASMEEERIRKVQEQLVLTEEMMRVNNNMMELDPIVRRALKEVGTSTWGKTSFEEGFPPSRFCMEERSSRAVMTSRSWGVGKRLPGPPAKSVCYEVTIRFDQVGDVASWKVEGQASRPAPLTIDVLAADLAEAYRRGPMTVTPPE